MNTKLATHICLPNPKNLAYLIILFSSFWPVMTQAACIPVNGSFLSQELPPDQCPPDIEFCTSGELTGLLKGSYSFISQTSIPAYEPSVPGAYFYTGYSFIQTRHGELQLTDTGTLDVVNGRISSLLTVTSGTKRYAEASGFLFVTGFSDSVSGINSGRYNGEICGVAIYKTL